MDLFERIKSPTPPFFKRLRNIGLALAAISTAVVSAPISIPIAIVTVAQYIGVIGAVISAVSQITISDSPKEDNDDLPTIENENPND